MIKTSRSSLRDHEQKPGGEMRQICGYKDKEGDMGGHLSLTGKAHGRAVTRWGREQDQREENLAGRLTQHIR